VLANVIRPAPRFPVLRTANDQISCRNLQKQNNRDNCR
jgi:hypothetical protein